MSLYELEGIPKAYSIQAAEVQKSREAKIQHLLLHVSQMISFLEYHMYLCFSILLVCKRDSTNNRYMKLIDEFTYLFVNIQCLIKHHC